MKTYEELSALKEEAETLNMKLVELTEEELKQVSGGIVIKPLPSNQMSGTSDSSMDPS